MSGLTKQALIDAINTKSKEEIVSDLADGILAIDALTDNFSDGKGGVNFGKISKITMGLMVNPKGLQHELGLEPLTAIINKYKVVNNG